MSGLRANILIGVTGSVATIKLPALVQSLRYESNDLRIKVITTERAKHFFNPDQLLLEHDSVLSKSSVPPGETSGSQSNEYYDSCELAATSVDKEAVKENVEDAKYSDCVTLEVLSDDNEWSSWKEMGDPVLHVELCKWADIFVIAPLDANTLGKLANGLCDNLLSCTFRAWDVGKPLVFCPAMNTRMWTHPMTGEHVSKLVSWGHTLVSPISKKLACGDEGTGAMAEVMTIVNIILHILKPS